MSEDSIQVGQDISRMVQEQEDTVQVAYRWNRIQVEQDTGGIGYNEDTAGQDRSRLKQAEHNKDNTGKIQDRMQARHDTGREQE